MNNPEKITDSSGQAVHLAGFAPLAFGKTKCP